MYATDLYEMEDGKAVHLIPPRDLRNGIALDVSVIDGVGGIF